MHKFITFFLLLLIAQGAKSQLVWKNADSAFGSLPSCVHIYFTEQKIDTAPFRAFYVIADLRDKYLDFTTDTTYKRRLSPQEFYERNGRPLLVVNGTFFSFQSNSNLNVVINDGRILSNQPHGVQSNRDSTSSLYIYGSAIGIDKKRNADIAWVMTDSTKGAVFASQIPTNKRAVMVSKKYKGRKDVSPVPFMKWNMETAIGGGPVLVQKGEIRITNEAERKFRGKGINDKHPRTAMGYTSDGRLIILMVEGRNPNASGASLKQLAEIFIQLNCVEAINLDGGGSSCLLLNGKETIRPSDKEGQRPVPAVFMIRHRK